MQKYADCHTEENRELDYEKKIIKDKNKIRLFYRGIQNHST